MWFGSKKTVKVYFKNIENTFKSKFLSNPEPSVRVWVKPKLLY
jgi:hypothetical protein